MSPRIFLVDDDPVVTDLVREAVIGERWDFAWRGTVSGSLEAIAAAHPDLVLLDVNLPDGEGFSICSAMRAEKPLAALPVIFLTTMQKTSDRLRGFSAGAQDYVAKPFEPEVLLARIRAHLAIKNRQDSMQSELLKSQLHERVSQDVSDMVVHDLRAPLTTIRITLSLLERDPAVLNSAHSRLVGFAQESLDFALLMINDLLDLGAGKLKVTPAPLDSAGLADKLGKIFTAQSRERGIEVACDFSALPKRQGAIRTDTALLFRILVNLVINALKFSPKGSRVLVKAAPSGERLRFEVIDQGRGIPDAEKEAIFKKYYRTSAADLSAIPGTGIGLSFCRLASEALGGRTWVEDAKPQGSRFIVELPKNYQSVS